MRTASEWFDLYGESHQDPVNKLIHWVCIPAILVSTLGLFQAIPFPVGDGVWLHWGTVVAVASLLFYATLSPSIFVGMALVGAAALGFNGALVSMGAPILWVSVAIFAVAWVVQFVGHKIEGKKPSFFQDLQFLLVGPAWLLQFIYRKVGIPVGGRQRATS